MVAERPGRHRTRQARVQILKRISIEITQVNGTPIPDNPVAVRLNDVCVCRGRQNSFAPVGLDRRDRRHGSCGIIRKGRRFSGCPIAVPAGTAPNQQKCSDQHERYKPVVSFPLHFPVSFQLQHVGWVCFVKKNSYRLVREQITPFHSSFFHWIFAHRVHPLPSPEKDHFKHDP